MFIRWFTQYCYTTKTIFYVPLTTKAIAGCICPVVAAAFLVSCQSPANYQSDITTFGQGVIALKDATDNLHTALVSQNAAAQSAAWTSELARLRQQNCFAVPATDGAPSCVLIPHDQTGSEPEAAQVGLEKSNAAPPCAPDPAPITPQVALEKSMFCLELVEQYAAALAELTGSTDPATAAKDTQALGQSINAVATAVGNRDAAEKGSALAISGLGQALFFAGSVAIADWQYNTLKDVVGDTNDSIKAICDVVGKSYKSAYTKLWIILDNNFDPKRVHILDIDWPHNRMNAAEYQKELPFLTQARDRLNLYASAKAFVAASELGAAHDALNESLQGRASLPAVALAMAKFLDAAQRAQAVFQQASTPVAVAVKPPKL